MLSTIARRALLSSTSFSAQKMQTLTLSTSTSTSTTSSGYKSSIALQNLYPQSGSWSESMKPIDVYQRFSTEEKSSFSGFIPVKRLEIKHKTCSKPGGQHVNRTLSGVEVRFHVESAEWIPDWIRDKLQKQQVNRITRDGFLIVKSEKTRKAILNQADCMERIRSMIFDASVEPTGLTDEELRKIEINKKIADGRRLVAKRKKSDKKSQRKRDIYDAMHDYYN